MCRSQGGFTLVETLVVITLMAILAAVLVPDHLGSPKARLQSETAVWIAALRGVRLHAMRTGRPTALSVDTRAHRFEAGGTTKPHDTDRDFRISMTTARNELEGNVRGRIRFFPDGSSGGGRITLGLGDLRSEIQVDWLTGRIHLGRNPT